MNKRSHILIKNVYYMLSYAFTTLQQKEYEEIAVEEFENLHNLFAAILNIGISRQIKQGLYREYLSYAEELAVVRGKIDLNYLAKHCNARNRRLCCEYDELSENNLLNQILKSTILILLCQADVDTAYKVNLRQKILFFSNVDTVALEDVRWDRIHFQRQNGSYQLLINICRLIAEGMLLTTERGQYELASFLDDQHMHRLYEKFILEYYRKNFPLIKVESSQIHWVLDDNVSAMLPIMQSDIMLSQDNKILIIDAKYYSHATQVHYGVHTLHSGNLYQIFTYVKNKFAEFGRRPHDVSGMILYAKTAETVLPDNVYHMSGNKISVKTLDLNQEFSGIEEQLCAIIREHFSHASSK